MAERVYGHIPITGAIVYYVHGLPANNLSEEISLIQAFKTTWDANVPAEDGRLPSASRAPPPLTRIVVAKSYAHPSTNPDIEEHVTIHTSNEELWAAVPPRYGATVRIYPIGNDITNGFDHYARIGQSAGWLNSPGMATQLAASLGNRIEMITMNNVKEANIVEEGEPEAEEVEEANIAAAGTGNVEATIAEEDELEEEGMFSCLKRCWKCW